jgi:hypothetical protein
MKRRLSIISMRLEIKVGMIWEALLQADRQVIKPLFMKPRNPHLIMRAARNLMALQGMILYLPLLIL